LNFATSTASQACSPVERRRVALSLGSHSFAGHLETSAAPASCAWLLRLLPLQTRIVHARWSGEAGWVPLGPQPLLAPENATVYPQCGHILLYAGGLSEPELLIPYGACAFGSKAGALAGNHVITLDGDLSRLSAIGNGLLWHGGEPFRLALA